MSESAKRVLLMAGAVVAALLLLELGLRAADGYLGDWSNLVLRARTALGETEAQRFVPDPKVGYVPKGGTRGNGVAGAVTGAGGSRPIVLAVGDSYTYGEEVGDDETWPAFLQAKLAQPVVNGGVSGFGFDQIVLRAEALAAQLEPGTIVAAFIADDIRRAEMRRMWGAEKPYFVFEDGRLLARNLPVPPRPDPASTLSIWQRLLGRSYLFDFVLRRLDLLYDWFGDHIRVHPAGTGERIACVLTERLAALQKTSRAPNDKRVVLVVALYDPVVWQDPAFAAEQRRMTQGLLACAARQGLATLDSFDAIQKAGAGALYKQWHMNAKGNQVVADLIAQSLSTPR